MVKHLVISTTTGLKLLMLSHETHFVFRAPIPADSWRENKKCNRIIVLAETFREFLLDPKNFLDSSLDLKFLLQYVHFLSKKYREQILFHV